MNTSPSLFPSVLRTVVPLVAGWVITALVSIGVNFPSEQVTAVVTAVITAGYYLLFRLLEKSAPTGSGAAKLFGLLLGYARPPEYPATPVVRDTPTVAAVPPSDPVV